jgi:hypothetical protein
MKVIQGQASQKVQRRAAKLRPCDFEMVVLVWS